jgi:hypothetical protein
MELHRFITKRFILCNNVMAWRVWLHDQHAQRCVQSTNILGMHNGASNLQHYAINIHRAHVYLTKLI